VTRPGAAVPVAASPSAAFARTMARPSPSIAISSPGSSALAAAASSDSFNRRSSNEGFSDFVVARVSVFAGAGAGFAGSLAMPGNVPPPAGRSLPAGTPNASTKTMGYARPRPHRPDPRHETLYTSSDFDALVRTERVLVGGTSAELMGGIAAVVLAVIGIAGCAPSPMAGAATVAIGVAMLAQGASIAARWTDALRRLAGGVGTEIFAGVVGIVLGVLALAGVIPQVLRPVAAIVIGTSLLLGSDAQPALVELDRDRRRGREVVRASAGALLLAGVAAIVLGIVGLLGLGPEIVLSLVAMLSVGGALVLTALTAWLVRR
jgi:hypothetical protein